jgi:hypothetical protein
MTNLTLTMPEQNCFSACFKNYLCASQAHRNKIRNVIFDI